MTKKKILIFIVAYNAEKHLEAVLKRIPKRVLEKYHYEILIIDDASPDRTFEVGKAVQKTRKNFNIKVLYNPVNQGYGGNQKIGYKYAVKFGFDAVVLLHGDGQYAPEMVEDMVKPILEGQSEAVFGSRMLVARAALRGHMPKYKYLGNKILTSFQNRLLGTHLSEFHSGYRAYSTAILQKIPFEKNTNDFHFDTQIIIQLFLAGARIKEMPIPTYYGQEICHVNGMKYAADVVKTTISSKLHSWSILYQPEYDLKQEINYPAKIGYSSSHTQALQNVPVFAKVLSIGCGDGYLETELHRKGCSVTGIDVKTPRHISVFDKFFKLDLDNSGRWPALHNIEVVLLLDIIEHLANPEKFMNELRYRINGKPKIIITTGNIGFILIRLQLLGGNFNYGKRGILDLTHKRLFTYKSMAKLLTDNGYVISKTAGIPVPFPAALGDGVISRLLLQINRDLIGISKNLFAYQMYFEAYPLPTLDQLLNNTLKTTDYDFKQT